MVNNQLSKVLFYLKTLASCPTAPFHEHSVYQALKRECFEFFDNDKIKHYHDTYGNLHLEFNQPEAVRSVTLIAHADHPAFEVFQVQGQLCQAHIYGGLPREQLLDAPIIVVTQISMLKGTVKKVFADDPDRDRHTVTIELKEPGEVSSGDYATVDFPMFEIDGDLVKGVAMDDLSGCAAALAALDEARIHNLPVKVHVILTRAEEAGFLGSQAIARDGILERDTYVISLEASKALTEAPVGEGPVIRVGDKMFLFDANTTQLLQNARKTLQAQGFKVQSFRMIGGTCEASTFLCHGYQTGAVCVPLLNYHNGGEIELSQEAISINDLETEVTLLVEFIKLVGNTMQKTWAEGREAMNKRFEKLGHKLTW